MFNITTEVNRLKQLEIAKIEGLPYKPKEPNPIVQHIDGDILEIQAGCEGSALKRMYKSRTQDFGIRLRKAGGQSHRRRGHHKSGKGI